MLPNALHFLDHCWVCNVPFGPSLKEERHHLIPRAYGGVDGPQVSLCDSHHTALHTIALRLYSKKPFTDLLTGSSLQDKKLVYLAQVVCNSRLATENDPNKRQVLVLTPSKETLAKLDRLKALNGRRISRENLIELAIHQLYSKHFID